MSNKPDLRRAILAAVMLLLLPAVPVAAKQVALVVGNARYDNLSSLNNPTRDAAAVSDRLRSLGFEVVEALDADTLGLGRAAETFLGAAKSADLALFYFAGHGIQLFDRNFLLARDVDPATAKDGKDLGIDLSDFMDKLRHAGPVRIALLIDACRDNPLSFEQTVALMQRLHGASDRSPAELARAVKKIGLADIVMAARTGSAGRSAEALIFFAAQPGRPSFDGRGLNSYFVEGLKEGLSQPGRPLMETFRKVSAYVRTVTNGGQVPQIVSDWTEDVTFGTAVVAAKVSYNLDPDMPEADRQLVIRTVSGYKRFTGDFIVAASMGTSEDNTLTDAEKERAKKLTSPSVLSLSYDFDRDGRDETLHVYFRQISYIIVLEQEGIRAEIAHCFGDEEIQDIEIALKDINGDRKPEIWIAMDDGNFWSRICILEFQGLPDLDSRRRANLAGDPHVGYAGFRTLLRTGQAAWNVTVGNDNSIKACAGTGCHSSTIYTFDGQHFTWVLNGGTEPDPVHRRPFRDEAERARQVYEAYRAKAQPLNAVNWQRTEDAAASSARAAAKAGDTVDIAYRCSASPGDVVEDVVLIKSARNPSRNNSLDV
ncbi:MAG: caspase family protein, partial [Hyphomicrobiaceae bacterium]